MAEWNWETIYATLSGSDFICLFTKKLFSILDDDQRQQQMFDQVLDIIDMEHYRQFSSLYQQIFTILLDETMNSTQKQYYMMHYQTVTLFEIHSEFMKDSFTKMAPVHCFYSKEFTNYYRMMNPRRFENPIGIDQDNGSLKQYEKSKLFITCFCNHSTTKTIHQNGLIWNTMDGLKGNQLCSNTIKEFQFSESMEEIANIELSDSFLLSSSKNTVTLWKKEDNWFQKMDSYSTFFNSNVDSVSFSPFMNIFACTDYQHLFIFDINRKLPLRFIDTYQPKVSNLVWYNTNTVLTVSETEGVIWDIRTPKMIKSITTPNQQCITASLWKPTTNTIALGEKDGYCTVWDIRSEKRLHREKYFSNSVLHLNYDFSTEQMGMVSSNALTILDNCFQRVYTQPFDFPSVVTSFYENNHWRIF